VMIVSLGFVIFSQAVRFFPIFADSKEDAGTASELPVPEVDGRQSFANRPSYARSRR